MNPDLARERSQATFDPTKLACLLCYGREMREIKNNLDKLGTTDPDFKRKPITSMSREEAYEEGVRTATLYNSKIHQHGIAGAMAEQYIYRNSVLPNFLIPTQLHQTMFMPLLQIQGTEEQYAYWKTRDERGEILGTYAQTELGHGTFLRGLEMTATYDESMQEFVLNSPTLTSIKWWPGGMGKTCNHAIVVAQLYTKGKCHGVHQFIVQLRDIDTHATLPGLTLGDIGPKIGFHTVDNGFLHCDHYRIPRENMLMKHAQVSPDGVYTRRASDKVMYGGMVMVRATMSTMISHYLAQACTIAIRYSAVRRQSEITPGAGEVQVLDFQTQQEKLLPVLATTYALLFTSRYSINLYMNVQAEMSDGNFSLLEQLHSSSAGLKAYCTWTCLRMLETCRQACGGHGYLDSSGMTKLFSEMTAAVTYEGDNTVMVLQSARLLMKYCERVKKGEKLDGLVAYLNYDLSAKSNLQYSCDIPQLVTACEHRTARMLIEASKRLVDHTRESHSPYIAWNMTSVMLSKAALAHSELISIKSFVDILQNANGDLDTIDGDPDVVAALTTLCRLYILHCIITNLGDYTVDGYVNAVQAAVLQTQYEEALADVRVNAVAFVDAFECPDEILESDLGRYDGRVYEAMYETAKKSSLNATDVHPVFHKYIKPMMQRMKAKSKL